MRTLGNIPIGNGNSFPPAGKHQCRCMDANTWTSPVKGAAAAKLTFTTPDALYQFDDLLFIKGKDKSSQAKVLSRLALVASRLCGMPKNTEMPDDDLVAAKQLARYIVDHAKGKDILLTINEQQEDYIVQEGPQMGQTKTTTRCRVAFGGYEILPESEEQGPPPNIPDDDIPF